MAEPIPFVTNDSDDLAMVRKHHADSKVVHVPLRIAARVAESLPKGTGIWVDPEIDRYHHLLRSGKNKLHELQDSYLEQFREFSQLADARLFSNLSSAAKRKLNVFVDDVMNKCAELSPKWITIPQLPLTAGRERNAVNKFLCTAACRWQSQTRKHSCLILPVVFSETGLYGRKGDRTTRIKTIAAWYEKAQFDGVWIADSTLSDQQGRHIFRDRFRALVNFHEELAQKLPANVFQVAGPYWGMNLVLWARNDVQFPAIGLGRGYQYFIPGGQVHRGNLRLPLPPLKRWAQVAGRTEKSNDALKKWLASALRILSRDDSAYKQFRELYTSYDKLKNKFTARRELARFYSKWCAELQAVPPTGRALMLWQALSSAYVLGKQLPPLPEGGRSGAPARVAKQLMDCCL